MEHTKGPWHIRNGNLFKEGSLTEINPNLPHRVCQHCGKPSAFRDGSPHYDPVNISIDAKGWGVAQIGSLNPVAEFSQHMANARLISAAPDLLAALKDAYAHMKSTGAHQSYLDQQEAAIKKAGVSL